MPIDCYEEVEEIIKALKQEPCEDCISRQAVIDIIDSDWKYEGMEQYVNNLPSVNPQPKTGWWLHRENMDYLDKNKVIHNHFMCKDCGFIHDFIDGHTAQYKYCPHCGAKMVEPQERSEGENG